MDLDKIKQEILDLYEICLEKTEPFHIKIDICLVPNYLSDLVFQNTGIDISNHLITIDNYGIIHSLHKHGNPISESKRGQVALQKEDFIKFIDVIFEPDSIVLLDKSKRSSLPLLQFEKVINDRKIVVKEIRTITSSKKNKVSRLVFHTMYKFKSPTKLV